MGGHVHRCLEDRGDGRSRSGRENEHLGRGRGEGIDRAICPAERGVLGHREQQKGKQQKEEWSRKGERMGGLVFQSTVNPAGGGEPQGSLRG